MFHVPCPTPDGRTAEDLYQKRVSGISAEMSASAWSHGCRFHRAWFAADGSAFYAIALWESREGANAFFREWEIPDERARSRSGLKATLDSCLFPEASLGDLLRPTLVVTRSGATSAK